MQEIEDTRTDLIPRWLGEHMAECLRSAGRLFMEEGYPLPKARSR